MNQFKIVFAVLIIFLINTKISSAQFWNLPKKIDSSNCTVKFKVDSTWHMINGKATKIDGELALADPKDYTSIKGFIKFPIVGFDTKNTSRDQKMRRVMHADKYPEVLFKLDKITNLCNPDVLLSDKTCIASANGTLEISGTKRSLTFPIKINFDSSGFNIRGQNIVMWNDYGVEDPSILVARLAKEVKIDIKLILAPN